MKKKTVKTKKRAKTAAKPPVCQPEEKAKTISEPAAEEPCARASVAPYMGMPIHTKEVTPETSEFNESEFNASRWSRSDNPGAGPEPMPTLHLEEEEFAGLPWWGWGILVCAAIAATVWVLS